MSATIVVLAALHFMTFCHVLYGEPLTQEAPSATMYDGHFARLEEKSFAGRCEATRELSRLVKTDREIFLRVKLELEDPLLSKEKEVRLKAVLTEFYRDLEGLEVRLWHIPDQYRYENGEDICATIFKREYDNSLPELYLWEHGLYNGSYVLRKAEKEFCRRWLESFRSRDLLRKLAERSQLNYEKERKLLEEHSRYGYYYFSVEVRVVPPPFEERILKAVEELKELSKLDYSEIANLNTFSPKYLCIDRD